MRSWRCPGSGRKVRVLCTALCCAQGRSAQGKPRVLVHRNDLELDQSDATFYVDIYSLGNSQSGKGLWYNHQPLLHFKNPSRIHWKLRVPGREVRRWLRMLQSFPLCLANSCYTSLLQQMLPRRQIDCGWGEQPPRPPRGGCSADAGGSPTSAQESWWERQERVSPCVLEHGSVWIQMGVPVTSVSVCSRLPSNQQLQ